MTRQTGFTLMELLITVIAIALLAAVALPQYTKAVERSRWQTAQDLLQTIYSGEQVYQVAKSAFVDADACATAWRCIYMDNPNTATSPVAYEVSAAAAKTFSAKATRKAGVFMTIDENRTLNTASWPMP